MADINYFYGCFPQGASVGEAFFAFCRWWRSRM
jgi:hypothetical protein